MTRIKEEEIPDALLKWINNENDIWLFRYTRSIGYTFEEIAKIAERNEKIRYVIDFITESLIEKTIYRVAEGSFNADLAAYIFNNYLIRINNLTDLLKPKYLTPSRYDEYYDDVEEIEENIETEKENEENKNEENLKS